MPTTDQMDDGTADAGLASTREAFSEVTIPRGSPENVQSRTATVYVPEGASNLQVKAFMKNEIWGGAQNPPKPNTDDLGTSHYIESPMGGGDSPIAWAKVSSPTISSQPTGRAEVSAVFSNWAGRNDRTGKLAVTYTVG